MLKISEKESILLEILSYIIDEREFQPFVFSHDTIFDEKVFTEMNLYFLDLVSFLGIIGISIDFEKERYDCVINDLLCSVTNFGEGSSFWFFNILSIDFSNFNINSISSIDYPYIRLFIFMHNGASLNKGAICKILNRELSSNDITQLKKVFARKTAYGFVKNSDNSYSFRRGER